MSVVLSGYLLPLIVTAGYSTVSSLFSVTVSLPIHNHVSPTNKYIPLVGSYSTEDVISGWIWDRRVIEDWNVVRTRHNTFIGGKGSALRDGTMLEDWQSGTMNGCKFMGLTYQRKGESLTWTPQFSVGTYSIHHDDRVLFSDYSYCENFDNTALEDSVMTMELREDALYSTVKVSMFARSDKLLVTKWMDFKFVEEFTGEISGATRLPGAIAGVPNWGNLSDRKHEFIIYEDKVRLNKDWSVEVGTFTPSPGYLAVPAADMEEIYEYKGIGVADGRAIFTALFPLQAGSVRLFTRSIAPAVTEWTETADLNLSTPADQHFMVDYDLGIITIGGFQAGDLMLSAGIGIGDTEIYVYPEPEVMAEYAEVGIILIGTEQIKYEGKSETAFLNCERGYNGTTPAVASTGDVVEDLQRGAGTADDIFIAYTAVPRVEYEVTTYEKRTANHSPWLDVKPSRHVETNEVVQITAVEPNLDRIVLKTDANLLGGNLYGPLYFGTDVTKLTATAYDSYDNPVENIELTIETLDGSTGLNGSLSEFTDYTNSLGDIYAFYNTPYNRVSIETRPDGIAHVAGNTEITINDLPPGLDLDNVWLYQVLKHDRILGGLGKEAIIDAEAGASMPWGLSSVTLSTLIDASDFEGGIIWWIGTDALVYQANITHIYTDDFGSGPVSIVYIDEGMADGGGVSIGQTCWLLEPEALKWDSSDLDHGVRVILYEWDANAYHPLADAPDFLAASGAYVPIHPDSVSGDVLTFNGRTLPIPAPDDNTSNLGGYVLVMPKIVSLQARGTDPITGYTVTSNIIRILLDLPVFLTGVDYKGGVPIPYGWTFPTETFNIGAGLGGANFITINPQANYINQFNVTGVI